MQLVKVNRLGTILLIAGYKRTTRKDIIQSTLVVYTKLAGAFITVPFSRSGLSKWVGPYLGYLQLVPPRLPITFGGHTIAHLVPFAQDLIEKLSAIDIRLPTTMEPVIPVLTANDGSGGKHWLGLAPLKLCNSSM